MTKVVAYNSGQKKKIINKQCWDNYLNVWGKKNQKTVSCQNSKWIKVQCKKKKNATSIKILEIAQHIEYR